MRTTEAVEEARRVMTVCNACRYCEGFCAVFPAMELRRVFSNADLSYLANLCHGCRDCYYACPYTPPHEFGINVPRTFAELRMESYAEYSWPGPMARMFRRNGLLVSLVTVLSITLVLVGSMVWHRPHDFYGVHLGPGAFYALIPSWIMLSVAGGTFGFALLALCVGAARFWRDAGGGVFWRPRPLLRALGDILTLRNLGGGGQGCNDRGEGFSRIRRRMHHALFYGFMLTFASTCVAAIYEHVLGLLAPYPFFSPPVLLGTAGGIGMVIGCGGLLWIHASGDREPAAPGLMGSDLALLFLLLFTAATGLALLALRATGAMGVLLAVHLGFVLSLFLVMPYSRFVHGIYRAAALVRNAIEQQSAHRQND